MFSRVIVGENKPQFQEIYTKYYITISIFIYSIQLTKYAIVVSAAVIIGQIQIK